jgi:hypothetical protein
MTRHIFVSIAHLLLASLSLAGLVAAAAPQGDSRSVPPSPDVEKAEQIIHRALESVGGQSYLNVRSVVGRGFYTAYKEGVSQLPARFLDYVVYPDRERTEFTGGGVKVIQTNLAQVGWLYDGASKTIKDMKQEQLDDFKLAMRASFENLLRGWWRKEGVKLSYAGRREAGVAKRNETVRLTYPDGFWVEFEMAAQDGLPAKVIYKRQRKNPDTDEMEDVNEEDRLAKPVSIDGVVSPFVIDHYVNGIQTSRINVESVEYNRDLPDSLFTKPTNLKSLK